MASHTLHKQNAATWTITTFLTDLYAYSYNTLQETTHLTNLHMPMFPKGSYNSLLYGTTTGPTYWYPHFVMAS